MSLIEVHFFTLIVVLCCTLLNYSSPNSSQSMATVKLASGHEMPLVGFGLWKVPKETAADTVYNVRRLSFMSIRCND